MRKKMLAVSLKSIRVSTIALFTLLNLTDYETFGQLLSEPTLINPIPPSPNAASLGTFGNIPVSLYTGGINVQIPFFTVVQDNFSLPITLNYSGGGVKVEEIAPNVGLSWSLNAGGLITRTVFGRDDFGANGYLTSPAIPTSLSPPFSYSEASLLWDYAKQNQDSEPDVFYFNFAGKTGKFVLDKNGVPHIIPYQKLKISGGKDGWIIITEDGIEYKFGTKEYQQSLPVQIVNSQQSNGELKTFNSSWYLDEIKLPHSDKLIKFTYQIDNVNLTSWETGTSESKHYLTPGAGGVSKSIVSYSKNWTSTVHVSKIEFESGEVEFVLGNSRCDLLGDKLLSEIIVRNIRSEVVKRFLFRYSYWGWQNSDANTATCSDFLGSDADLRLILKEIKEVDFGNAETKNPYVFDYYEGSLPPRNSKSQDHWGYFNDSNNQTLIPDTEVEPGVFTTFGTDRNPRFEAAVIGSLKKIEYPTGGTTTFEYEPQFIHTSEIENLPNLVKKKSKPLLVDVTIPNLPTYIESEPFLVGKNTTCTFEFAGSLFSSCVGCDYIRWLLWKQQPDGSFVNIWTAYNLSITPGNENIPLVENGIYKISHEILTNAATHAQVFPYSYSLDVKWNESIPNTLTKAGGIRISKITDHDPISGKNNTRIFEYKQSSDNDYSGFMVSEPKFYRDFYSVHEAPEGGAGLDFDYSVLLSANITPLSSTQGSFVGYSEITEYSGIENLTEKENSNGKTIYKYFSPVDFRDKLPLQNTNDPEHLLAGAPYPNIISEDWKRGLLKEQTIYSQTDGIFKLVKQVNNYYTFIDRQNPNTNYSEVLGFKAGIAREFFHFGDLIFHQDTEFKWGYYRYQSGYHMLDRTVETTYDQNDQSRFAEIVVSYSYNLRNLQIQEQKRQTEKGNEVLAFTYPTDYQDQSGFVKNLVDANIINVPIEKVHYSEKLNGSNKKIIGGEIDIYDELGKGLLQQVFKADISPSNSLDNFKFSNQQSPGSLPSNSPSSLFSPDQVYQEKVSYAYNPTIKKLQSVVTNKEKTDFIWGYNNTVPIAKTINNSAIHQYFHTSFEEDTQQTSTDARTGLLSHIGVYVVSAPEIIGNYLITYWEKNTGGEWTFKQINLTITNGTESDVTIGSEQSIVDEIRLFPVGAMMTTYTYDPLIGVTSATDPNNVTTFYEYDGLGRLSVIKDNNGAVVKTYEYNYQLR